MVLLNRFTKEMMNSLNYSRKRANALWRLSVYKNLVNEPQIRFEYEAIIINKNLSNRRGKSLKKMLPQIKKFVKKKKNLQFKILFFKNKIHIFVGMPLKMPCNL